MRLKYEGKNEDWTERMSFSKMLQLRIQLRLVIRVKFSYLRASQTNYKLQFFTKNLPFSLKFQHLHLNKEQVECFRINVTFIRDTKLTIS